MTNFQKQIKNLENQFLLTLRNDNKLNLHPNTYVIIQEDRIEIGVLDMMKMETENEFMRYTLFGSQLNLNWQFDRSFKKKVPSINFGTNGMFNPENPEDFASVYRTLHSAEIVSNWYEVKELIRIYCSTYENICKVFEDLRRKENQNK